MSVRNVENLRKCATQTISMSRHKNRRHTRGEDKLTMHPTGCWSFHFTELLDYIQKNRNSSWTSETSIWRGRSDRRIIEKLLSSIENRPSKDVYMPNSRCLKYTGMGC